MTRSGFRPFARRVRRSLHERVGSDRYSRPSLHGIEDDLGRLFPKRGGYFIEAGANDGFAQSNTYWLERLRGWRGVLVEPVPLLARECRRNRPHAQTFACALVADPETHTVTMTAAGLMSLVAGARGSDDEDARHLAAARAVQPGVETYAVEVPARTLTSVLDEAGAPPEPDLLSLDVEGYEGEVLRGLDFGRYAPRFVLVEANFESEVDSLMRGAGYERLEPPTPKDALYRRG